MTDSPPPAGHNAPATAELVALRAEVERLRQALREAGRRETHGTEVFAAERLRHVGEMATGEGRVTEARIDAKAAWDKAAALGAELGRTMAEGLAQLRVAQATVASVKRANAAFAAAHMMLATREAELRAIVDSAVGLAILATDAEGRVLFWNVGAERLLRLDPDRAAPLFLAEAMPFDEAANDSVGPTIAAALRGERVSAENWPLRRSDARLWFGVEAMPLGTGDAAAPAGVLWLLRDRTEAYAAALALRESEERLRTVLEGIPQLVWRSHDAGRRTWSSSQWQAFTGQSGEESLAYGWLGAVNPEDRAATVAAWDAAPAAGRLDVNHRLWGAVDGAWRWHQTRALPVGEGESAEWLGTCTDIEDAIRAREVLARSREELEELVAERTGELERALTTLQREIADRNQAEEALRQSQKMEAVGRLTGGIAHDFNNMLQGVTGALAMAARRLDGEQIDAARRYLRAANDAALRAAGLTRRLLAFARRQRLEPRRVNPNLLVSGMAEIVRRTAGPAIAVELRLGGGAGVVRCDPNELESAVLNLCLNARDAMPGGGQLVISTADVTLSRADVAGEDGPAPGDYVEIRVEDSGTGMTPEVLARVTEPFFTTKPQGEGTGLGLSQVFGFVRQSGGLLRIESALGHGTKVRVLLPRRRGLATAEAEAPRLSPATHGHGVVLLVDDEPGVRGPAAERLRELGLTVVEAADGPKAVQLYDEEPCPDILVTDVGLPGGMNGRQVAEALRERCPDLPVLFISGYSGEVLPSGVEVIGKPFDLDELARRVLTVLGR